MSKRQRHRKRGYRQHFRRPPKKMRPYYRREQHSKSRDSNNDDSRVQADDLGSASLGCGQSVWEDSSNHDVSCMEDEEAVTSNEAKEVTVMLTDCVEHPVIQPQIQWKRSIRVLSLFDGIATGLFVLHKLGLQVEVYYSCETDPDAVAVQLWQHPGKVSRLGCVKTLTKERLKALGRVDLLLGGSPCNDLSTANAHPRGLHGDESTGQLFFEYVRIRNHLQQFASAQKRSFYWFFENTFSMEKKTKAEISRVLGSQPTMRCASNFVPMVRRRLFWGNLPGMHNPFPCGTHPVPSLNDLLRPHRRANIARCPTITTKKHSQKSGPSKSWPVIEDGIETPFTITELEVLFGFPEGYTDGRNPAYTTRLRLLGKSWCVPVIVSFLRILRALYRTK